MTKWIEIVERYGPVVWRTVNRLVPNDANPMGTDAIDGKTVELYWVKGIKLFGIDSRDSGKGEMKIWVQPKHERV